MATLDERILQMAKHNHIWLNAFSCIRPTVEFRLGLADEILALLNSKDHLIPFSDSEIGRLTPVLYLHINKS